MVESTPIIVSGCIVAAVLLGRFLNRFMPQSQLNPETRDSIKLAVGWVATMAALTLGLLLNSAKTNFDLQRNTVIQMAAKVTFLDRALVAYGPETNEARSHLRSVNNGSIQTLWPEGGRQGQIAFDNSGVTVYATIQSLAPRDDTQRALKTQTLTLTMQIGELRSLLTAQSSGYISRPLLVVLVSWLLVIFLSFSLLAPRNATALTTLAIAAFAISAAIFLIIELDGPFAGLIQIPKDPLANALSSLSG
jgi:hypothetical protein